MFKLAFLALVAVTGSSGASAQDAVGKPAAQASNVFTLTAKGDGAWSIWCDYATPGDDQVKRNITPDKEHSGVLSVTRMERADCHFTGGKGPLTLTISGEGWTCPFKVPADAICEKTFARLDSGEFKLRRASSR